MDARAVESSANSVQPIIENLLNRIARANLSMRLLNSADAYLRAANAMDCWVDPACAQQHGGHNSNMFWLEFTHATAGCMGLGAAVNWRTDDIIRDIESGTLWYPGGYAEYCALQRIELVDPSRLIGGSLSYIQLATNPDIEQNQDLIEMASLLLQALAFRHHHSLYSVHLGVHAPAISGMPLLPESFKFNDFLATSYFPPADEQVTLTLSHNSMPEFVDLAGLSTPASINAIPDPADVTA